MIRFIFGILPSFEGFLKNLDCEIRKSYLTGCNSPARWRCELGNCNLETSQKDSFAKWVFLAENSAITAPQQSCHCDQHFQSFII